MAVEDTCSFETANLRADDELSFGFRLELAAAEASFQRWGAGEKPDGKRHGPVVTKDGGDKREAWREETGSDSRHGRWRLETATAEK